MSESKRGGRTPPSSGVSRRAFLTGTGAAVAGTGLATVLGSCASPASPGPQTAVAPEQSLASPMSMVNRYPAVPAPPMAPPPSNLLHVFTPEEAAFVDALTSRIIPGDAHDPGAHEAGVVVYIDNLLAFRHGDVEPTYRQPPFTKIYTTAEPPAEDTVNGYKVVWVAQDEVQRYGYQSMLTPLEAYRVGLAATDRYARATFGKPFVQLGADQQDTIIGDLASGRATGFTEPTAREFFHMLRLHTIQGMFCDPLYGGNRNLVGWNMVGYPGAQRAYTPDDMKDPDLYRKRRPQSLADMMAFNPGENANHGVILPVEGSRQQ